MTRRTPRFTALILAAAVASSCAGADNDDDASATAATTAAPTAAPATTDAVSSSESSETPATTEAAAAATTEAAAAATTAPAASGEVDSLTWATYREANTLNPLFALDYPENTVIMSMCESLLLQQPDGTIAPGLATLTRPDDTTMVFTLRDGVTFWDGAPLTADDVVFSLQSQMNPAFGGFYGLAFFLVDSITATAPNEVTIKLKSPDFWLEGELSGMAGIVFEKAFAATAGAAYGTPDGGVMCTGAYQLDSWNVGDRITVKRYDEYWNGPAKVGQIDFVGVPDEATLTSGLLSGDIDGSYIGAISTYDRLTSDPSLTVTTGLSYASGALIISNFGGALGNQDVRTALSMAIDRQGLIDAAFHGTARLPKAIANPGTWGYSPDTFQTAWDALPEPTQDIDAAKSMVEAAGATGQTITIATSNEIAILATMANVVKDAAEDIGLEVNLQTVSAANYINLFIDPNARQGIDAFPTVTYPDFANPASLYDTFALPYGAANFSGYANPAVQTALETARATADPDARAQLVTEAQAMIQEELPWIGLVNPDTVLVTSADITGAPASFTYMFSPWAAGLGAAG